MHAKLLEQSGLRLSLLAILVDLYGALQAIGGRYVDPGGYILLDLPRLLEEML